MATHRWADVERELFPAGDDEEVTELEDRLRAEVRGLAGYVEALGGELELVANFGDKRLIIG